MTKPILTIFLLFTGLFGYAQSYETVSYNLNGTPANGIKIKTNLPYTNSSQMVNIKIEGYCYGSAASIGLNIVYYIYNDAFVNNSVSSWGAYTPDVYLSNESGLVCITLADKPYFPRFKVSAFAKGMPAETAANFTGWTVVDEVAAGTNITLFPYKNAVKNFTITGTATAPTPDPVTNNTQLATTAFVKTAITGIGGGYIQNSSTQQVTSNFNISGNGTMARLGLGSTPASNTAIDNGTALTGSTWAYGAMNRGIIQSDVTALAAYNRTTASTAAASFTVNQLIHNWATQGTFGAGSTVTSQYGFYAEANLIGADNNYGFYGNIPAGGGRFNLFMNGTAQNYLKGPTSIGTGSALSAQLATVPASDAIKGIVVKGFSGTQSANLQEWQASSGSILGYLSPTGGMSAAGGFVTPNNVSFRSLNTSGATVTLIRYDDTNRTIVGPNGEIQLSGGVAMGINGGAINLNGGVADGASAIGTTINTINAYSTAGAKILSIRNNGAEKAFFNKDGYLRTDRIGMGSVPSATANLYMNNAITGSATAHGSLISATVNSDVVTAANVYNSFIGTQASAFNLGTLRHYTAQQTALGAGSSITTQVGFWADASLSGATNNRGFYGSIPSGINNYNLYMSSGAFNYLEGNTGFGITPGNSIKLRVNTGADANVGVEIRGSSTTQTANLTEWRNSAGNILAAFTPLGVLAAPAVQNPVSANNARIDMNSTGTVVSRNVADAVDVLTVTNASATSTGNIQSWKFGSVSRMALSAAGNLTLSTIPATSAGTYNILTHNSTTGVIEKIASSALDVPWAGITGKPTTLVGYGITDAYSSTNLRALSAPNSAGGTDANTFLNGHTASYYSSSWLSNGYFTGTAGYGGLISFPYSTSTTGNLQLNYSWGHGSTTAGAIAFRTQKNDGSFTTWKELYHSGNFTNLNQLTTRNYSDLQNKPTTLAGFGVTDKVLKYVAETSGGNASDYGYWTKIASINLGASDYVDYNVQLGFAGNSGTWGSAIVDVGVRQNTSSVPPELSVSIMSAGPGVNWLGDDSFKLVSNGYGTKVDLYMKKYIIWGHIKIYEMASNSNFGSISYLSSQGWSATAPTGTYTANSSGIKYKTNNIYHAGNDNVLNHPINGFSVGTNTSVTAADHIKSAIEKLQGQINAKESAISAGTATQYRRGDKTWQTLNTSAVPEGTNLYHTSSRVLSTPLTGYAVGANTALAAGDTELIAFGKLQGQLNNALHKAGNELVTGTLGIGITSGVMPAGYKFAVGGGIIAESVKVKPQGEWPDYVFEKGYSMLSLGDLEKFILKNKHLPDVPAASEVKKEGLDLGEMDSKLLKKIEELTLYLIEKDKEIKRLSEEKEEEKKRQSVKDKEIKVLSELVKELSEDIKVIKNKQNP